MSAPFYYVTNKRTVKLQLETEDDVNVQGGTHLLNHY